MISNLFVLTKANSQNNYTTKYRKRQRNTEKVTINCEHIKGEKMLSNENLCETEMEPKQNIIIG